MAKKENSVGVAVPVDIGKLSAGLTMTFKGVSMVFDSIGAEEKPGFSVVEDEGGTVAGSVDGAGKDDTVGEASDGKGKAEQTPMKRKPVMTPMALMTQMVTQKAVVMRQKAAVMRQQAIRKAPRRHLRIRTSPLPIFRM